MFEDGTLPPALPVDTQACVPDFPSVLVVHTPEDLIVPQTYGDVAVAQWRDVQGCASTSTLSELGPACVTCDGCAQGLTYCTPACTVDVEPDGVCDGDQNAVWQPQGPDVAAAFLCAFS